MMMNDGNDNNDYNETVVVEVVTMMMMMITALQHLAMRSVTVLFYTLALRQQ
jgi:hypothetical protein